MGKTKYPDGKLCRCGCGQPTARAVDKEGRNKGYYRYATGHQPRPSLCDPVVRARAIAGFQAYWNTVYPPGSRRIRTIYGKQYWEIKVAGRRRWMLEHRHIMEQRLGRELLRSEHVHHRDDNGLNNGLHADGKDNLQLMGGGDHARLTYKQAPYEMCRCECPNCGARLKHFKKNGRRNKKSS